MANNIKIIESLTLGDNTGIIAIPYVECSTAAGTATKVVSTAGSAFSLEKGAQIKVKFNTTNTASNPTLKVDSTDAKAIYQYGKAVAAGVLTTGKVFDLIFDGNYWQIVNVDTAYDLAVSVPTGATNEVKLSLTGSDNTADDISIVGSGVTTVKIENNKVKIHSPISKGDAIIVNNPNTTPVSLSHNGTFTAVTATTINDDYQICDNKTVFKLPGETAVSVSSTNATTPSILTHGGTVDLVTAVSKGSGSHDISVTTTQFTLPTDSDEKVKNTPKTSTDTSKVYLTGTNSISESTGTQVFDTGVYLENPGEIVATTFKGTATNVSNKLTVGSRTFDGSTAVTISASDLGLEQAMKFLGSSSIAISDGATTNPITIGTASVEVTAGNVVLYGGYEYVWTGSAWEQLGDEGSFSLKTHTHNFSYTPEGTVSAPGITVTSEPVEVLSSIKAAGEVPTLIKEVKTAHYIDSFNAGSFPTLDLDSTITAQFPSVSIDANNQGDVDVTLSGSIPESQLANPKATPNKIVQISVSSEYTAPSLSSTSGAFPVYKLNGGQLPSLNKTEVTAHNITTWDSGSMPTYNSTEVFKSVEVEAAAPDFTGTLATITTSVASDAPIST